MSEVLFFTLVSPWRKAGRHGWAERDAGELKHKPGFKADDSASVQQVQKWLPQDALVKPLASSHKDPTPHTLRTPP